MSSPSKTVAFIGLGVMGYPMALNLRKGLDSSHTLLICDVSTSALEKFQSDASGQGPVEVVKNGCDAIQRADTVITMLPDSNAVKKVYLEKKQESWPVRRHYQKVERES